MPAQTTATESEWTTVVRRRGKGRRASPTPAKSAAPIRKPAAQQKTNDRKPRKPRPPRSSAVVITLLPEAEKRGATYADVLAMAKKNIDLKSLGISSVGYKQAATGAKILEVPGSQSGEQADALAEKIRQLLGNEAVRVDRPTKCVAFRLIGLDESVTREEVAEVVAKDGVCPVAAVSVGEIRFGPAGTGTARISCPIAAVNKIVAAGRILVGWVSARVVELARRPMRCFRCMEAGHVAARCTSAVDRGHDCYRCGKPGHVSAKCAEPPHCSLCATAGRKAGHRVGATSCAYSKKIKNKRGLKQAQMARSMEQSVQAASVATAEEDSMQS